MLSLSLRPLAKLTLTTSTLALLLAACSSDSSEQPSGSAARYALLTRVTDANASNTNYIALTDSLEAGDGALSLNGAIELPSGVRLFRAEKDGAFFVVGLPTVRKFEVSEQGTIEETSTLDFSARGITDQGASYVTVLSPEKAYLISNSAFKVVVFNPTTMEITGDFAIDLEDEEYPIRFSFGEPVLRDGKLVFSTWISDTSTELVSDVSHVIVLDTVQDRVEQVTRDERCGGLINVLPGADGTLYFFPDVWTASIHRLGADRAPESCLLRMLPGAVVPDPNYAPKLEEFTGSRYSAGALAAGGNSFYLFTLDEASAGITDTTTAQTLHSGPWWRWVRVDITQIAQGTPGELLGGTHYGWRLDGKDYTYSSNEQGTESTVLRVDQEGAPQPGLIVPGVLNKAVQLR